MSADEDLEILRLIEAHGTRWTTIERALCGRRSKSSIRGRYARLASGTPFKNRGRRARIRETMDPAPDAPTDAPADATTDAVNPMPLDEWARDLGFDLEMGAPSPPSHACLPDWDEMDESRGDR